MTSAKAYTYVIDHVIFAWQQQLHLYDVKVIMIMVHLIFRYHSCGLKRSFIIGTKADNYKLSKRRHLVSTSAKGFVLNLKKCIFVAASEATTACFYNELAAKLLMNVALNIWTTYGNGTSAFHLQQQHVTNLLHKTETNVYSSGSSRFK